MKSKEEILDECCSSVIAWSDNRKKCVLEAMELYAGQSRWISVETPPENEFWYRVLIDGKHHILPHSFNNGKWWCYGEPYRTPHNVTHYQSFEDLPTPPTP